MRLRNRRIIITGATSGIGLATARLFAREGARIACISREAGRAQETAAGLEGPRQHAALVADVTDPATVSEAVDHAALALGGLDGLVHSAGMDLIRSAEETSVAEWDAVVESNLRSAFLVNRACLRHLRRAGGGTIVNLASALGLLPLPARSAYAATKAGVIAFSKALAMETADYGVRVNALCPGAVDTPMLRSGVGGEVGDPLPEFLTSRFALRRAGTGEEVARAALFLTSDDSAYTTGTVLAVDGGRSFH